MAEQETIFDRWTKERNITVDEMKNILSTRIKQGLNDPDPKKRAQWEKIPHAGKIPTPEEWLRYAKDDPIFLKRKEVSDYLGISMDTLRNWESLLHSVEKRAETEYPQYEHGDIRRHPAPNRAGDPRISVWDKPSN